MTIFSSISGGCQVTKDTLWPSLVEKAVSLSHLLGIPNSQDVSVYEVDGRI